MGSLSCRTYARGDDVHVSAADIAAVVHTGRRWSGEARECRWLVLVSTHPCRHLTGYLVTYDAVLAMFGLLFAVLIL